MEIVRGGLVSIGSQKGDPPIGATQQKQHGHRKVEIVQGDIAGPGVIQVFETGSEPIQPTDSRP
jgi:hypothetical protein